jgi:hypothetical protein
MIYISCDIETSGLDAENNQILSVGAILEDTTKKLSFEEIPKFHCAIVHKQIIGNPFALNMNRELISLISKYEKDGSVNKNIPQPEKIKVVTESELSREFYMWLCDNGLVAPINPTDSVMNINGKSYAALTSQRTPTSLTFAGKNFGTFDKKFLEKLPGWNKAIRIKSRILDPSILFMDWSNDTELPNLDTCKQRGNVQGIVTHDAIEDAWDVVQLLRKTY